MIIEGIARRLGFERVTEDTKPVDKAHRLMPDRRIEVLQQIGMLDRTTLVRGLELFREIYMLNLAEYAGQPDVPFNGREAGVMVMNGCIEQIADLVDDIEKLMKEKEETYGN